MEIIALKLQLNHLPILILLTLGEWPEVSEKNT